MGIVVTVTLDDDLKPNYDVATVVAGLFVTGTTELKLWMGTSYNGGKSNEVNAVKRCLGVIREGGNVLPTTANVTRAKAIGPGGRQNITAVNNAAQEEPAETEIVVVYGSAFQPIGGATVTPHVLRALEKYLEDVQKSA